jgi:hypothetical protein
MMFDSSRPPSRRDTTFPAPDSTAHFAHRRSQRTALSTTTAARTGLPAPAAGGILHHRHIQAALIREWSPKMNGIAASIWPAKPRARLGRCGNLERDVETPGGRNQSVDMAARRLPVAFTE